VTDVPPCNEDCVRSILVVLGEIHQYVKGERMNAIETLELARLINRKDYLEEHIKHLQYELEECKEKMGKIKRL